MSDNEHIFLGTNYSGEPEEEDTPISGHTVYEFERQAYERGLMDGWDAACD